MSDVVVVGSGASAVHFAQSVLEKGHTVTMLDVGRVPAPPVRPEDSFVELKERLSDPSGYFLGERFEGVLFPGSKGEYYGFPPHRAYIFEGVEPFAFQARGFEPLTSFARGGLAEAWTGGVFPFTDAELEDYPFGLSRLLPYYELVARRIGVCGTADDLARFVPVHAHLEEPLDLDRHSAALLERYRERRDVLQRRFGCTLGRTRSAVLREDRGERGGCTYLGRCLWGCPREALYAPSMTLRHCRTFPGFRYLAGRYVSHFDSDAQGRVTRVVARRLEDGGTEEIPVERLALGAGTLSTSRIYLESIRRKTGELRRLSGLMDNRQILVPFVNLALLGQSYEPRSYQYHLLALGLEMERPKEYVHGLITTLKTALIHPIVQSVPLDLKTSLYVFRNAHGALGILNVNYHDTRREENFVRLREGGGEPVLEVHYRPPAEEPRRLKQTLKRLSGALRALGCLVPPGMAHHRPMGASVHYAGTLPMDTDPGKGRVSAECRSHEFPNLFVVDGATLPFLPAKNLTFTLMANAARIADEAF